MPAIVAVALRYVIMAAVQLGLWGLIEKYGLPMLNASIEAIMMYFGVPKETAQDIMANSILVAFEEVGIFAYTLKTKLPLKVADALGFTSKGWTKRALPQAVEKLLPTATVVAQATTVATAEEVVKVAEVIAKNKSTAFDVVSSVYKGIMAFVGVSALVLMTVGNFIDFANWQGAYQKTFAKLFTALGFPPDSPMPKAQTVSDTTWKKIYATVEELNPQTIAFPWDDKILPYSRQNLVDATDHFAANISAHGGQATFKSVFALLLPCISIDPSAGGSSSGSTTQATVSTPAAGVAPSGSSSSSVAVKVFTGLLTSGTLGSQPAFVPRESGLIESAAHLTQDAQQEAAAFLAALPASIVYEVRIVNYVVAPDGTRRSGTVQRIRTGTLKNGQGKYRVLRNKFAVLDLYYNDAAPGRTKLAELIIGPVDVAAFNPTPSDLAALTGSMSGSVVTSNITDISHVVSSQPITSSTPVAPIPVSTPTPVITPIVVAPSQASTSYSGLTDAEAVLARSDGITVDQWNSVQQIMRDTWKKSIDQRLVAAAQASATASAPTAAPVISLDFSQTRIQNGYVYNLPNGAGSFYSGPLEGAPAVPMGKLYEAKGLGPASTYTGNATQVARLDQLI